MMNKMRRADREVSRDTAMEFLMKGEYGILATVCEDGKPYAVPVNYAADDEFIYIHGTNAASQRNKNMQKNPKVCFTVVGKTEVLPSRFSTNYESAVVFGTAKLSEHPEKGLTLLCDKYSPEFREAGAKYIQASLDKIAVYEIRIEEITGKARE